MQATTRASDRDTLARTETTRAPMGRGRLSVRYRNGSVELIDDVDPECWGQIITEVKEKRFTGGFASALNRDSLTIINMAEVARISWIIGRGEDQP